RLLLDPLHRLPLERRGIGRAPLAAAGPCVLEHGLQRLVLRIGGREEHLGVVEHVDERVEVLVGRRGLAHQRRVDEGRRRRVEHAAVGFGHGERRHRARATAPLHVLDDDGFVHDAREVRRHRAQEHVAAAPRARMGHQRDDRAAAFRRVDRAARGGQQAERQHQRDRETVAHLFGLWGARESRTGARRRQIQIARAVPSPYTAAVIRVPRARLQAPSSKNQVPTRAWEFGTWILELGSWSLIPFLRGSMTAVRNLGLTAVLVAAMALAVSSPAWSHHSHAMFDHDKEVTITGTVSQYIFRNPHVFLYMDVQNDAGGTITYTVEFSNLTNMLKMGFSATTFKAGDKVTVTMHPLNDGRPGGNYIVATSADGKQLGRL